MDNNQDSFAARLRSAREKKNLTQSELSLRAGLDRRACSHLESLSGARTTGVTTIEKLAQVLEVSAGWLAFGEDPAKARIAQLREELAQNAAPPTDAKDEEEDGDEEDEDDDQSPVDPVEEAEECELNAWPWGHRTSIPLFPGLPPLGLVYRPVLVALGATMPSRQRRKVASWLLMVLTKEDHADVVKCATVIGETLSRLIAPPGYAILEQVVQTLASPDLQTRGMMALSLLVDAGLPVDYEELLPAQRRQDLSEELEDALVSAIEIIEHVNWFDDQRSESSERHPFLAVLEHYAIKEGGWSSMHSSST